MATLERPAEPSPSALDDIAELQASVPKPFPATSMRTTSTSRSPSASRLGGLMDKVKRAISKERDPMGDRTRTRDSTRDYECASALAPRFFFRRAARDAEQMGLGADERRQRRSRKRTSPAVGRTRSSRSLRL